MASSTSGKTSWSELKSHVRTMRRDLSGLSARVPTYFSFRNIEHGQTRLYFVASTQVGHESSIFHVDIKNDDVSSTASNAMGSVPLLTWKQLIHSSFQMGSSRVSSREEELQLERKRCASFGVSTYEIHYGTGSFVFPAAGSLYTFVDGKLGPCEIKTRLEHARLNPTICPRNARLVAFACNNDVWATNVTNGQEIQLTHFHSGKSLAEEPLSAGLPSYVTQEEFSRYSGFWWRPTATNNKYTLLYEVVDDSKVDILRFPICGTNDVDEFRFPKAGAKNSMSTLNIVQFGLNPGNGAITEVETYVFDHRKYLPWAEYLVRVGWTPDGAHVWIQAVDRTQQLLELVLIPIQSFTMLKDGAEVHPDSDLKLNGNPPPVQVIFRQKSDAWINVSDNLIFLRKKNAKPCEEPLISSSENNQPLTKVSERSNTIKFIIASEETGWKHLYLVTALINSSESSESYLTPHIVKKVALTQGQWCISGGGMVFDELNGFVFFHGNRDTPLENHLYAVSLKQPCNVARLTTQGYSHACQLNAGCNLMVDVFSSIHNPPSCQLFRIRNTNGTAEGLVLNPIGWLHESKPPENFYNYPELYSYQISSGDKLYSMVLKPHNMEPGKKYPVVLCVYGGPEVQLVSNTFKGMRQMRSHMLAQEGYYVVSIDSRGSSNRGLAFESHLRLRMGQVELQDQVEVLRWLGSMTESMDMDRVAIYGWSYGGYLSLMGLVTYPELFKVCVAGAPVTSWANYDTGYTERYMGLPANNSWSYNLGSIVSRASDFPDEPNRLLLVHGLMDENVHFYQHTAPLIQSLVKHGKPYQLQLFPNERHSLRRLDASEQYETTFLHFLQSCL